MAERRTNIIRIATAAAVAIVVVACSGHLREAETINLAETPVQQVRDMFAIQTKNGLVLQRLEAPLMQRFERDTVKFEAFPEGFALYGYTEEGLLESIILADNARHIVGENSTESDVWEAFGNVMVHNTIQRQTMETDTLYWNRKSQEIWTDCYVKMYSPDGFMQGYGMRSDERARNSILLNPFDSYGYTEQDTTVVVIDSVNFIGPFKKN